MTYMPRDAGDFELHVWVDKDGDGARSFFPGCPLNLHVSPGRAAASASSVRDTSALMGVGLSAGERLSIKVQLHDTFGNCAVLAHPDEELVPTLEGPTGTVRLGLKQATIDEVALTRQQSKKNVTAVSTVAVGAYEIVSPTELTVKGEHKVSILLHGEPISGSAIAFTVRPAVPVATKSWLQLRDTALVVNEPCETILHLVDRYANAVDRGEVRVDAKAFGPKASECTVTDQHNGLYSISFIASVPGDYKVQVRLENVEMQVLMLHVDARSEGESAAAAPAAAPVPEEMGAIATEITADAQVLSSAGVPGGATSSPAQVATTRKAARKKKAAPSQRTGTSTPSQVTSLKTVMAPTASLAGAAGNETRSAGVLKAKTVVADTQRAGSESSAKAGKSPAKKSTKTSQVKKGVSFGGHGSVAEA